MDLSQLTPEENQYLQNFTNHYQALQKFETSKGIWYNQIGALTFVPKQDYVLATYRSIRADHIVHQYLNTFPEGCYKDNALNLLKHV